MIEINYNTKIVTDGLSGIATERAVQRLYRDISFTLNKTEREGSLIRIKKDSSLKQEEWRLEITKDSIDLFSASEEGVIYGLIYISAEFLAVKPLWYWCDQRFIKKDYAVLNEGIICSEKHSFKLRGWFINDEVLFLGWKTGKESEEIWEMAFEALLRLGGNIVIPGTDKNARKYFQLASDMGLWIAQHHAEPLGAEMFSRAYPDLAASYNEYPELYQKLWRESVQSKKDLKILWSVGFRGQGDVAFWEKDPSYDTDEKRALLIESIIKKQIDIVKEYCKNPLFAFNVYNEAAVFYREGLLRLPDEVIKLFADNGYGKMVQRREWNVDTRTLSLPAKEDKEKQNGMYYHVSFYDLQAANHITATPVPLSLIANELNKAWKSGIRNTLILNVSNIKPHLVGIKLVSDFWNRGKADSKESLESFCKTYYGSSYLDAISFYNEYSDASIKYGKHADNRAGDQYYTYPVRMLLTSWLKGEKSSKEYFFVLKGSLIKQMHHLKKEMEAAYSRYEALNDKVSKCNNRLLRDNLLTHVKWYMNAAKANVCFVNAYDEFANKNYIDALLSLGESADSFLAASKVLRKWEKGKWTGFYSNEALTDTMNMVDLIKALMEYVLVIGDGPYLFTWQRKLTYSKEDRDVVLITNYEPRKSGYELYREWKETNH